MMERIKTDKKSKFLIFLIAVTAFLTVPVSVRAAASEPNSTIENQDIDVADPNKPSTDFNEEEDTFTLDFSSLMKIQEAYGKIFTPELVKDNGLVNYSTLRRKRNALMDAAKELENLNPALLMNLPRQERIAFWINTYNACTLKLIIDRYPIEPKWYMILYPNDSIMQIPGAWTKVYFDIQQLEYSLKEIEQDFLLNRYQDPRICFALSYASIGGANLRNEPYKGDKLEEQLNDQVKLFLNSEKGMRLDKSNRILYLSNLFQIHKDTFLDSEYASILKFRNRRPEERAWLNFILPYMDETDITYLEKNNVTIKFIDYDWHLNETSN